MREVIGKGAAGFIVKPFNPAKVLDTPNYRLEKRRSLKLGAIFPFLYSAMLAKFLNSGDLR